MSTEHPPASAGDGLIASRISKGAVQILAARTGRGPTKVRTYVNEDLVTILFQDLLTKSERTLTEIGQTEPVLQTRRALQEAMSIELVKIVEEFTGRTVAAFLSANHLAPDIEIESFVLEPL